MSGEEFCHACGQTMPPKYRIWHVLTQHLDGCSVRRIAQITGYSKYIVKKGLTDLFNEGKAYFERGKWYPEMAVS